MKLYDITVPFSTELPVYPGDPAVQITQVASLAAGDICTVSHLSFGSHTGTHVDPPAHFVAGAATLDELSLDVLIGPARVVDVGEISAIDVATIDGANLAGVERVLFKTRNSIPNTRFSHSFESQRTSKLLFEGIGYGATDEFDGGVAQY